MLRALTPSGELRREKSSKRLALLIMAGTEGVQAVLASRSAWWRSATFGWERSRLLSAFSP